MADDSTKEKDQLPDAAEMEVGDSQDTKEDAEEKIVSLWKGRFTKAEDYRRPIIARNMRMWKLYRAYRAATNYAYGTSLMPPIGFEIIETVKPRLASAEIKVNIYPTKEEDIGKKDNIAHWEDLIEYDFQVIEFDDKKIMWIDACLLFGNGFAQLMWNGDENGDPFLEIVDNWLFYPDPQSQNRLKNSRWEIKQSFKNKALLKREEKDRGEDALYDLMTDKKWEEVADEGSAGTDPRKERYEINTLKMGQINDGSTKGQATDSGSGESSVDKEGTDRMVEIWECFDHVEKKLQVIFNRKVLARDDENPYLNVNGGRVFIDLPDISLPWELYGMSHLEPVETTIHEIADSRNQAMDDIIYSLDPIRKVRKGKGYKDSDIKHSPGAIWYLEKADDVVIERPPEVSRAWVEKDNLLRREIESSLALSEYVRGVPNSGQEPVGKVELLLMQTNIRFSLLVRQMEIAFGELVNALIELNQEYLGEKKSMRILGGKTGFRFAAFTSEDKEVNVDATVDITPKKEKSPEQESNEVLEMYKLFVVEDKPDANDEEAVLIWKKKKAVLQKLIVEKMGYDEYADTLAPELKEKPKAPEPSVDPERGPSAVRPIDTLPPEIGGDNATVVPELLKQGNRGAEQIAPLPIEDAIPTTPETAPRPGFLARLLARARGGRR